MLIQINGKETIFNIDAEFLTNWCINQKKKNLPTYVEHEVNKRIRLTLDNKFTYLINTMWKTEVPMILSKINILIKK